MNVLGYEAISTIGSLFSVLIGFVCVAAIIAIGFSLAKAALRADAEAVSEAIARAVGALGIVAAAGAIGAIASWCISTFAPTSGSLWEIISWL